jgi:hypothetical protein
MMTLIRVTIALTAALLAAPWTPAGAQGADAVSADLQMAEQAAPMRAAADAFIARAAAGDLAGARALLSAALVKRIGEETAQRALQAQILPFFTKGGAPGQSVTITRTTDAAGQQGFAFYMWWQAPGGPPRPFTIYTVAEGGRPMVANVVPDRLVEGRHR